MNVIYSVKDYVTNVFDFHQGTISGAIDIVAVQHDDNSIHCSPFHVHFGKTKLKRVADKVVQIVVNGHVVDGVHMKLGAAGEAYFVDEVDAPVEDADYTTSPIASPLLPMYASTGSATSATTSTAGSEKLGVHFDLPPQSTSAPSSRSSSMDSVIDDRSGSVEWHDAYRRLVPDAPTACDDAATERLTWGWGALPTVVQPANATTTAVATAEASHTDADDDLPLMVKSDSVYFDAIESESRPTYLPDPPCVSLCGHLLGDVESQDDARAIFTDHIVPFETFRDRAVELLRDPNLMVLLDNRICRFSPEVQAACIVRVLFPNSLPLSLSTVSTSSAVSTGLASYHTEAGETDNDGYTLKDGTVDSDSYDRAGWPLVGVQIDSAFSRALSPRPTVPTVKCVDTRDTPGGEHFHCKTLLPTQADLLNMNLRFGTNDIEFVVQTTGSGTSHYNELRVQARLFYWPLSAKIVIAEIDGAVARLPSSRRFASLLSPSSTSASAAATLHDGALAFYAKLAQNGYCIVYLTSRGLSHAELIHSLLQSQTDSIGLPNGPVLFAPDRLLATTTSTSSSSTEVIDARAFQVAALTGVRALFPADVNPFYAAFVGRTLADTNVLTQVGVIAGKVFVVDACDGRVRHQSMLSYRETYASLLPIGDTMFPPLSALSPQRVVRSRTSRSGVVDATTDCEAPELVPESTRMSLKPKAMKRIDSVVVDDLVSDVMTTQARTRSMGDEAYNDLNFWRIRPGRV